MALARAEIARVIEHVSSHLDEPVTIEDMAARVGMSRAVFHRKFKQATSMSPIQTPEASPSVVVRPTRERKPNFGTRCLSGC